MLETRAKIESSAMIVHDDREGVRCWLCRSRSLRWKGHRRQKDKYLDREAFVPRRQQQFIRQRSIWVGQIQSFQRHSSRQSHQSCLPESREGLFAPSAKLRASICAQARHVYSSDVRKSTFAAALRHRIDCDVVPLLGCRANFAAKSVRAWNRTREDTSNTCHRDGLQERRSTSWTAWLTVYGSVDIGQSNLGEVLPTDKTMTFALPSDWTISTESDFNCQMLLPSSIHSFARPFHILAYKC